MKLTKIFKRKYVVRFFLVLVAFMTFSLCQNIFCKCIQNPFSSFQNQDWLLLTQVVITIIGGGWALYLYYDVNTRDRNNFLRISVEVKTGERGLSIIKTLIKNETNKDRVIDSAFLIITPIDCSLIDKVNENLQTSFKNTNEFISLRKREKVVTESFAFIPIHFYTSENIKVGNEDLTYSIAIRTGLQDGYTTIACFDVRFFVFRQQCDYNNLHRSVQDILILKEGDLKSNVLLGRNHFVSPAKK